MATCKVGLFLSIVVVLDTVNIDMVLHCYQLLLLMKVSDRDGNVNKSKNWLF